MDRPYAYTTPEGGVQLAWNTNPGSIELEANPDDEGGLLWTGLGNGEEELGETRDISVVLAWVQRADAKTGASASIGGA